MIRSSLKHNNDNITSFVHLARWRPAASWIRGRNRPFVVVDRVVFIFILLTSDVDVFFSHRRALHDCWKRLPRHTDVLSCVHNILLVFGAKKKNKKIKIILRRKRIIFDYPKSRTCARAYSPDSIYIYILIKYSYTYKSCIGVRARVLFFFVFNQSFVFA